MLVIVAEVGVFSGVDRREAPAHIELLFLNHYLPLKCLKRHFQLRDLSLVKLSLPVESVSEVVQLLLVAELLVKHFIADSVAIHAHNIESLVGLPVALVVLLIKVLGFA